MPTTSDSQSKNATIVESSSQNADKTNATENKSDLDYGDMKIEEVYQLSREFVKGLNHLLTFQSYLYSYREKGIKATLQNLSEFNAIKRHV